MLWVKTLPCLCCTTDGLLALAQEHGITWYSIVMHCRMLGRCTGPVEADHGGDRAYGTKAPDLTCIPLCTGHHTHRTYGSNMWWNMTKAQKVEWRQAAVLDTQRRARLAGWDMDGTAPVFVGATA